MTDNMPMMLYIATYDSVSAAMTDLAAIEQLHKDKVIGNPYVHLPRVLHLDPGLGLPRPVVLVPAHRGQTSGCSAPRRTAVASRSSPTSAASSLACWRRES